MPANAAVTEGTFGGGSVAVHGSGPVSWTLTADVLGGQGTTTARTWGDLRVGVGQSRGATLRVKTGVATTPVLPQMEFRAGGIHTVRGYQYGTQRGAAFWSAQADVTPIAGPVRPVLFVDAGWAGSGSDYFSGPPLVGAGIGLSIYSKLFRTGIIRFDFSRAFTQRDTPGNSEFRFDLILTAVR
jgi:outer membrane protein assembly factor BamA